MRELPVARTHHPAGSWSGPAETVTLDYEGRFLRRKRLASDAGWLFLVDLDKARSLEEGDALELSDGRLVEVRAATEPVIEMAGSDLARLAWHIGNRHTPCQILPGRLRIARDPVIAHMLEHLGASLTETTAPFTPEGGAYGHGRTHSHAHGATAHDQERDHAAADAR